MFDIELAEVSAVMDHIYAVPLANLGLAVPGLASVDPILVPLWCCARTGGTPKLVQAVASTALISGKRHLDNPTAGAGRPPSLLAQANCGGL
jgi:hypothetical protein